jgi:hypothetical protein
VLYSFCRSRLVQNGICTDGSIPGLVADASGTLYGTTTFGGYGTGDPVTCDANPGCGVVFAFAPVTGKLKVLHRFMGAGNNDGALPVAQLAIDQTNKDLYGTTLRGHVKEGADDCSGNPMLFGCGTIFTLTAAGRGYQVLHTFAKTTDGAHPQGALLLSNNSLYGTARVGGGQDVKGGVTAGRCIDTLFLFRQRVRRNCRAAVGQATNPPTDACGRFQFPGCRSVGEAGPENACEA